LRSGKGNSGSALIVIGSAIYVAGIAQYFGMNPNDHVSLLTFGCLLIWAGRNGSCGLNLVAPAGREITNLSNTIPYPATVENSPDLNLIP
jgi:hypothetical protein